MSTGGGFALGGEITVSRVGYGAMRLTGQSGNFGRHPDWEGGKALLRRAVDLGVQFFDTARAYGPGDNEDLIAEALHGYGSEGYPANVSVATKGGVTKSSPNDIRADGRPETLRREVEDSLRRLRLERIDLYQLHRPEPTPRIRFMNFLRLAAEDLVVALRRRRERRAKLRQLEALLRCDDHLLRDMGADRVGLRAQIATRRRCR